MRDNTGGYESSLFLLQNCQRVQRLLPENILLISEIWYVWNPIDVKMKILDDDARNRDEGFATIITPDMRERDRQVYQCIDSR